MRFGSSVLLESAFTPAVTEGVALAEPTVVGAGEAARVWAHGALALPVAEATRERREGLPRAVFLAAVTEIGQLPAIAPVADPLLLDDPVTVAGPVARLAFSVDVAALFGGSLPRGAFYLHAAWERHVSPVRRFAWPPAPGAAVGVAVSGAVGALCEAYGLMQAGLAREAATAFTAALADPRVTADFDGAHLYNAACAAARAGLLSEALRWLAQDLTALAARLDPIRAEMARGNGARALRRKHDALQERRAHVSRDPDLDDLRLHPGWAPLAARRLA